MEPLDPTPEPHADAPEAECPETPEGGDVRRILGAVRFAAENFLTSQTISEHIEEVLEELGTAAGVSRVYVFENELAADGDLVTCQRFEWAAPGVPPQIENPEMKRMSYERSGLEMWARALSQGRTYESRLGEFSPNELAFAQPQGIQSYLLVPLMVEGSWWGFIGFDECESPRRWCSAVKDALQAAASILSAAIQGWNARREKERLLERQRAFTEAAWRRAAEWEAVLASIVDGVWVVDTDMQVTFANEGARRIFDARRIEDLLRPWSEYAIFADILDASENPVDLEEMPPMRALQGHATSDVGTQIVLRSKGERKFLGLSAAPIRDPAGKIVGAVAVATDRTQQVEFGRLKDQFIRVAAHELKTPVAIMKGYAQLALRVGDETSPAQLERLRAIDRGSDRIDRIIQDLLSVSQVYAEGFSLQIRPADLRELTVAAIGSLSKETPDRDIRLEAPDPAPVQVDVDRIEYVLRSLLDNAIRYSPAGGPIEVTIEVEPKQEAARAGGRGTVTVSVADQGIGIAPSKQAQVFEPFFRVHTDTPYDYGGMGVGLFTSREIVRQHGGSIWFESTEGEGSTFYFRLPLGDGDDRAQGVDRG